MRAADLAEGLIVKQDEGVPPTTDEITMLCRMVFDLDGYMEMVQRPVCRICGGAPSGLYALSHGRDGAPDERLIWLCASHTGRAAPRRGMKLIALPVAAQKVPMVEETFLAWMLGRCRHAATA